MTRESRWRTYLVALLLALPAGAEGAPSQGMAPRTAAELLAVPLWYLNYTVTLKVSGKSLDDLGSARSSITVAQQRVDSGTVRLGTRTPGPTLSLRVTPDPMLMLQAERFATWAPGVLPDDAGSVEAGYAAFEQSVSQGTLARESYEYRREELQEGWEGEGGRHSWGTDRVSLGGTGTVRSDTGTVMLEIDAESKTYRLILPHIFVDTAESDRAATGERVVSDSGGREDRQPVEEGLHTREGRWLSVEGLQQARDELIVDGALPGPPAAISGTRSFKVRLEEKGGLELDGTLTVEYALSSSPPEPAELVIVLPEKYGEWQPLGDKDETTAGDEVPLRVRLQSPGGGVPRVKARRFTYFLKNTSHERGVCMNWPPSPAAESPFDLQFEEDENKGFTIIGAGRQTAEQDGQEMTEGRVVVSCFDYGAFGEFEAQAELMDGRIVHGVVEGTAGERIVKLPARKDGSRIASAFMRGLGDLEDKDDSENDPVGDGFKGDGLTLYEEYRGFRDGDDWTPGDPKRKDVFVLNQMRGSAAVRRGIKVFEEATGLKVHSLLEDDQVNAVMVINFYCTECPHVVDQHVIRIQEGLKLSEGETAAFVEEVGTPGTARSVHMPPDWAEFRLVGSTQVPDFERTLAHEMSHDCNVWHHGEADMKVRWEYATAPEPHVVEIISGSEVTVSMKNEDGSTIRAYQFFPPNTRAGDGFNRVWLGVQHGQHSGHDDCLMRYDCSWAYISASDPSVRYLVDDSRGPVLCDTAAGTGVNAPGHKPQSRYGSAATPANGGPDVSANRGKCRDQVRVNDRGQEPER